MRLAARVLPLRDPSLDLSVDVDVSVDAYVDVDGAVDIDRTFDVSVDSVHAQVKDEVKVHGAVNVNVNAHVREESRSGRTRAATAAPPRFDPLTM